MAGFRTAFLLLVLSLPVSADIAPGDFLFLYARIVGCGDSVHVMDYAQVSDAGVAVFSRGYTIFELNRSSHQDVVNQLRSLVARQQGGHVPESLSVRRVAPDDHQRITMTLLHLATPLPCESAEPPLPRLDPGQRLAVVPAEASHRVIVSHTL